MKILFCFILFLIGGHCANILIVYETARRSHQIWIGELAEALIEKGHNVTMGGSFSRAIDPSNQYHPITFEGIFLTHYKINKTRHLQASVLENLYLNYEYNYAICNRTYQSKGFNFLWNYPENFKFDLILMDLTFGPCLYPLSQKFGSPTVGFTPSGLSPYLLEAFGNNHAIFELHMDQSFFSRLTNFLLTKFEIFFKKTWERTTLEYLASNALNATFDFKKLENSISYLLVNEHPLLNIPRPLAPNIIPVGGLHIKKTEPLPGILGSIIENAHQGLIFFSLGTDIQQNIFSKETKKAFAKAFMRLHQKTVIWKDNADEHPYGEGVSNILMHKWMPQGDLLGHRHAVLLITTGGSMSVQEAIFQGVPVVGIPIYGEQHGNVQFIVDNKLGLKLDYDNLTEENIFETLDRVLKNPIYKENMEALSRKFRDQPQNPLQKALYWIEYSLRHNSTNFLNPRSRYTCPWIDHPADVQLFLFFVFLLSLTIIVLRILWCNNGSRNDKKKKE
ncbi:unnamed protein product [Ceutorhynchus assimilis]|uniref:UDP-glucuronosyltransferase n=1 Tax=Ceutorhynchus assimilis TaxID=467358 RepID=A0A9N9MN12_9CUCU|nr:unnamed protein product [Ceutorhynchus assimilis]